jgi:hypothetical protein
MRKLTLTALMLLAACALAAPEHARLVQTPYKDPKVVFDFYFDRPDRIGPALFWVRSLISALSEPPYGMSPEAMDIVVVIHGTEIVTVAKKNYERYREAVERMRYYASLGVKFRVCGLAAHDYGYALDDLQEFVEVVPSAIPELVHWQQQGYAMIIPQVMERRASIEEIR